MLSKGMDGTEFSKHSELHEAWQDGLSIQNNWMYCLTTLKLVNCDIEPYAIPSKLFPCLKSLKILEVRSCNKVKQIFAKNDTEEVPFQLNTLILEDLSKLTLDWEKKFRGIHSFQNMTHVSVIGCKSIQTLFPTVLAENLKRLEKLEVKSCDKLREIVGKEEVAKEETATKEANEVNTVFPRITILKLWNLHNL
ncbi:hypothetical protein A2U01_0005647, partial [Trifolium medium]|nr:hypothetical protein [Trifolium medium]